MSAVMYIGDAIETMNKLPAGSVDLILTSPPFLALRSYLPADHPDKAKEGGSQSTPGEFIDWLIDFAEASARVLAPHGSFCVELGDTYSGSGGAGGDYAEDGLRKGQPKFRQGTPRWDGRPEGQIRTTTSDPVSYPPRARDGWPMSKSLSLIPELFRLSLVYGFNPLTGRQTERWRLRNVVRWVRPNPPVGALGDKFRPATSELMVFCKSAKRYFDLDSVRGEVSEWTKGYADRSVPISPAASASNTQSMGSGTRTSGLAHEAKPVKQQGAPPLDYWNVPLVEGEEPTRYGPDEKERQRLDAEKLRPRQRYLADGQRPGGGDKRGLPGSGDNPAGAPPLDWWNVPLLDGEEATRYGPGEKSNTHRRNAKGVEARPNTVPSAKRDGGNWSTLPIIDAAHPLGSPPLDWWEIPPGGYEGSHYAVFPLELCVRPVKAMSPERVCRVCGEPSRRMTDVTFTHDASHANGAFVGEAYGVNAPVKVQPGPQGMAHGRATKVVETTGWTDCGHDDWRPGLILDCFGGSGTVAAVATGHGRNCVLIDLDERNFDLALGRVGPWFLSGPYRLDDLPSGQLPPGWPDDVQSPVDVQPDVPPAI